MKSVLLILKKVGVALSLLTVSSLFADQWLTGRMEALLANPEGTSSWIWFYGFVSMLLSLLYPLASLTLVIGSLASESALRFLGAKLPQLIKEQLRTWGQIMTWSLLFILPGIYRFIELLFVPLVVCLDSAYARGEKDALQAAKTLAKGQRLKLTGLVFLFVLIIPVLMTTVDDYKSFFETPLTAILICLVEMLLNLSFGLILWTLYRRSFNDESQPHLSVERH